jgi:hypothetical protein
MKVEKRYKASSPNVGWDEWKESTLENIVEYCTDNAKSVEWVEQTLIDSGLLTSQFAQWRIKEEGVG